jgi:hypothetical protein
VAVRRVGVERGVLGEYPLLQLLQGASGVQAELVAQPPPPVGEYGQRVGLAIAAIERQRLEPAGLLPQRMGRDQAAQAVEDLRRRPASKHHRAQPLLGDNLRRLQPHRLRAGERQGGEPLQRGTAPQTQRLAQQTLGTVVVFIASGRLGRQPLEPGDVDIVGADKEPVAAGFEHDGFSADHPAQPGDVALQGGGRADRRIVFPQCMDEGVRGDRAAAAEQKCDEDRLGPAA